MLATVTLLGDVTFDTPPSTDVAEFEVLLLEHRAQAVSPFFRQEPKKRRAIQDFVLVLRHGVPIGGKIHRTKRATSSVR